MAWDPHPTAPLLSPERGRSAGYDLPGTAATRRHEFRSRSPAEHAERSVRQKYLLAGFFLVLSLISFVVQTETAEYIQTDLGWKKPYMMLYLTHGSWTILFPLQLLILRLRKPYQSTSLFLRSHALHVRTTAQMVMTGTASLSSTQRKLNPVPFITRRIVAVACALTIAGSSWYIAVNLTTPSDLTAIYSCSAFFAYVFSVPMLGDRVRLDKSVSVVVAFIGVLIVAYGDGSSTSSNSAEADNRLLGNVIIGVGSVIYGFYEVLYKAACCPPDGTSPARSVIFSNFVASGLGLTTLSLLWIPIPFLHWLGWESFELPSRDAACWLAISVASNVVFSGSFLIMMSLTNPVLSSVAALLTIFLVAITDVAITGRPLSAAALIGGLVISAAFALLVWSTWREMKEDAERRGERKVRSVEEEEEEEGFTASSVSDSEDD